MAALRLDAQKRNFPPTIKDTERQIDSALCAHSRSPFSPEECMLWALIYRLWSLSSIFLFGLEFLFGPALAPLWSQALLVSYGLGIDVPS